MGELSHGASLGWRAAHSAYARFDVCPFGGYRGPPPRAAVIRPVRSAPVFLLRAPPVSVLGQGLFLAIEFLACDRISDHLFVAIAIAVHDHHSMSPCAGGMMEVAPDLLLKEWLALPDSLGFDGQVVADHESVFDVHINVSSERTAARARPTFLRLRARRFFKHPMAFSTFDSHVLAAAFYRSRGPRPSVDGVAERNGSARPRARRAGRPRGGAPDRAVPPDPWVLCHRLLQSQVPSVVRLQGPPAVPFPVEHDGLIARRRGRRLKLADQALHARPDRGEAVVPDGVDRPYSQLQASPASQSSRPRTPAPALPSASPQSPGSSHRPTDTSWHRAVAPPGARLPPSAVAGLASAHASACAPVT